MKNFKEKNLGLILLAAGTILLALASLTVDSFVMTNDDYLFSRSVKLVGNGHACSGQQVKGDSGKDYILSAAHCHLLADKEGNIMTITQDGKEMMRRVIAEDSKSDLLLLEGIPNLKGLQIAKKLAYRQNVITVTHGKGLEAFKTIGAAIQAVPIKVIVNPYNDLCVGAKFKEETAITDSNPFGIPEKICVMEVAEIAFTAPSMPGSSGGMIVNENYELVSIVSAGDGVLTYGVQLSDIQNFIKNY